MYDVGICTSTRYRRSAQSRKTNLWVQKLLNESRLVHPPQIGRLGRRRRQRWRWRQAVRYSSGNNGRLSSALTRKNRPVFKWPLVWISCVRRQCESIFTVPTAGSQLDQKYTCTKRTGWRVVNALNSVITRSIISRIKKKYYKCSRHRCYTTNLPNRATQKRLHESSRKFCELRGAGQWRG